MIHDKYCGINCGEDGCGDCTCSTPESAPATALDEPTWGNPDWDGYVRLFNDITFIDHGGERGPLFSARKRIAEELWELGYRKPEAG